MMNTSQTNKKIAPATKIRKAAALNIVACVPRVIKVFRKPAATYRGPFREITTETDRQIGSYTIGKVLGEGGFGRVLEATSPSGEIVAIKTVPLARSVNSSTEASVMIQYGNKCPNLMGMREAMCTPTNRYMVMSKGAMDLATLLMTTDVFYKQSDAVQQAMKGILLGVRYMHRHGIAHLDIKWNNIMVLTEAIDQNNNLIPWRRLDSNCFLVSDFGCAKFSKESTFKRGINAETAPENAVEMEGWRGTMQFMAPEIIQDSCSDARSADMWSFGISLLPFMKLMDLEDVFALEEESETLDRSAALATALEEVSETLDRLAALATEGKLDEHSQVLRDFLDYLEGCGAALVCPQEKHFHDLLMRCLKVDPSARITAGQALRHPFFKY